MKKLIVMMVCAMIAGSIFAQDAPKTAPQASGAKAADKDKDHHHRHHHHDHDHDHDKKK
jgi:Ni/Co efflux regulator RcnB